MSGRRTVLFSVLLLSLGLYACSWDPKKPFEREAPEVNRAIASLDAGDVDAAAKLLADYLQTGACAEGNIGTPERLRARPQGSFDLGLAMFGVAERYGQRFGDEESEGKDTTGHGGPSEAANGARKGEIECALRIVRAFAADAQTPLPVRARAYYLEGNLQFMDKRYKDAVSSYDRALALVPGAPDAGDDTGLDAAWNRAIALRREDDKKDAGQDASPDANNDGGGDSGSDGGNDASDNKDGGDNKDSGKDDKKPDAGNDAGNDDDKKPDAGPPPPAQDAGAKPPPRSQDDRMLDQLENAPTVQQEAAKKQAQKRAVRGSADK